MKTALLCLVLVAGCSGSTAASRQATLSTAIVVTNTAIKSIETYDQVQGDAIVAKATDRTIAVAELAKLRHRVADAIKVCQGALEAIGIANSLNTDASLNGVKTALDQAIAAVVVLTGGKP